MQVWATPQTIRISGNQMQPLVSEIISKCFKTCGYDPKKFETPHLGNVEFARAFKEHNKDISKCRMSPLFGAPGIFVIPKRAFWRDILGGTVEAPPKCADQNCVQNCLKMSPLIQWSLTFGASKERHLMLGTRHRDPQLILSVLLQSPERFAVRQMVSTHPTVNPTYL